VLGSRHRSLESELGAVGVVGRLEMGEAAVEIELVAEDIPRAESSGFVDPFNPSTPRPSRARAVPKREWAKLGFSSIALRADASCFDV
jgi:hypothetical protein